MLQSIELLLPVVQSHGFTKGRWSGGPDGGNVSQLKVFGKVKYIGTPTVVKRHNKHSLNSNYALENSKVTLSGEAVLL